MLIVSGRLWVKPNHRDQFLASCEPVIRLARQAPGCLDFALSADPMEDDRVNVYEAWTDAQCLEAFRGSGPDNDDIFAVIVRAEVQRHEVLRSGPP